MNNIPSPQPIDPRETASAVLNAVFKRDAAKALAKAEILSDDLWAYGCNLNPRHVGIVFLVEPQALQPIHGGQWTAVWRPEGDGAYWGDGKTLICQQCYMETGEETTLRLRVSPSSDRRLGMVITMEPEWRRRFLHRLSRSELSKYLGAKETEFTDEPVKPNPAPAAAGRTAPAAAGKPARTPA